ncbi:ABC transporter ATP-binding protein [Promicromonospora sp. NPDC050249]|uniref:ABC transporter ATP-binding protein n=1 Tax=Promicromonospora sp. NPDC050249 TaxID=3154743 RepID=UPI0033EBF715
MSTDHSLPIADGRTVLREMWRALDRRGWRMAGLVVVFLATAAAGVLPSLAIGELVDAVTAGGEARTVWVAGAIMAGSVVAGAVLAAVGMIGASRLLEGMLARMREDMVTAALRLPQSQVERAGTGDLISRAGDDVAEVAEAIPAVVPALTGSFFTIVVTFGGMAVIDPRYALALLVILPVHAFAVRRYLRGAPRLYAGERAAMAHRAQHLLDSLRGIETVRAFDLSGRHLVRIRAASWAVVRWTMHARAVQNAFSGRINAAELAGMTALLVVGFFVVRDGGGTIGGTTAAMLLFLRLFNPIGQLLFVIDDMQSALASLARITGVVGAGRGTAGEDSGEDGARSWRRASDDAGIGLRGVGHSYSADHPVLVDVDLQVAPGETVAVVGASGAGKSTLAALAAGVHDATSGIVETPDGVVLVTQEVHVFDASLRDNLTLARADADDAALRQALGVVGAQPLVDRLPDGLDTRLDGSVLTPAEAQQLALARVLLADPGVVVLDEATAEAGSSDAGRLERAAQAVIDGRTALVVAHRLSQAAAADRVVVMERGRIAEEGTHAELLASGGSYARLWEAWRRHRD